MTRWLTRESASNRFIAEIDGLRFLAITSVVLYHLNDFVCKKSGIPTGTTTLSKIFHQGFVGVELFFLISGFVIALPFAKHHLVATPKPQLKSFYLRRFTRLEPPYFLNLLILFVLLVAVKGESPVELLPHLVASLFYVHNFVFEQPSLINHVAWSLEMEFQFYLLAPFFCSVFAVPSPVVRRALIAAVIAGLSIVNVTVARSVVYSLSVVPFLPFFFCGFLLADLWIRDGKNGRADGSTRVLWDVVGAMAIVATPVVVWQLRWWIAVAPVLFFLIACAAFRGSMLTRFFRWRPIYTIGGHCYTTYLYHFLIISLIGNPLIGIFDANGFGTDARITLAAVVIVPCIFLSCAFWFLLTERPFMIRDWPSKAFAYIRGKDAPKDSKAVSWRVGG